MKYKITIQRVETNTYLSQEWERQYSDEIFEKLLSAQFDADLPNNEKPKQYDYVTKEITKTTEEAIYEQTTDDEIDLKAIIDAFNKKGDK